MLGNFAERLPSGLQASVSVTDRWAQLGSLWSSAEGPSLPRS